jgi:hypothetical protein
MCPMCSRPPPNRQRGSHIQDRVGNLLKIETPKLPKLEDSRIRLMRVDDCIELGVMVVFRGVSTMSTSCGQPTSGRSAGLMSAW